MVCACFEEEEALVTQSFSAEDLTILRSVLDSSISVNIQKIDLITDQLRRIRNALLQAESHLQEGATANVCH